MKSQRAWMIALAVAGLAVASYLAIVHHSSGQVPLACAAGGVVNCELVTSSAQSMIGLFPVADLGVIWFVVTLGLLTLERVSASERFYYAELAWSAVGLLMVLYLIYAELFLIGAICVWCTVVHVLTIGLFLLALARIFEVGRDDLSDPTFPPLAASAGARTHAHGAVGREARRRA